VGPPGGGMRVPVLAGSRTAGLDQGVDQVTHWPEKVLSRLGITREPGKRSSEQAPFGSLATERAQALVIKEL
jgi:hypothetical protein